MRMCLSVYKYICTSNVCKYICIYTYIFLRILADRHCAFLSEISISNSGLVNVLA